MEVYELQRYGYKAAMKLATFRGWNPPRILLWLVDWFGDLEFPETAACWHMELFFTKEQIVQVTQKLWDWTPTWAD